MKFNIEDLSEIIVNKLVNVFNSTLPFFINLYAPIVNRDLIPEHNFVKKPKNIIDSSMIAFEPIAIFGDDFLSLREEFKSEFNKFFSEKSKGYHTVYLCVYEQGLVIIETVKVMVYSDCPLFFFSDSRLVVKLDKNMNVFDANLDVGADLFLKMFYGNLIDLHHVGPVSNSFGFTWEIFTLLDNNTILKSTDRYIDDKYNLDILKLDESEMIEIALDFTAWRKEKFIVELEASVNSEGEESLSENNPFESQFYMESEKVNRTGIRTDKVFFGEQHKDLTNYNQ